MLQTLYKCWNFLTQPQFVGSFRGDKMVVKVCVLAMIASLCQALNYMNTPIPASGLHYEPMGNVRFTTAEWKFVTYIDLARLVAQRPVVTEEMLANVNQTCQVHETAEVCTIVLHGRELLQKRQVVETLLKQLDSLLTGSSGDDYSMTASEEDAFQGQLHHIHDEMDTLKNQTLFAVRQLHEAFAAIEKIDKKFTYYLMIDKLQGWTQQLQVEFSHYIDFLRAVIETVHAERLGIMHLELFSFEKLENALHQFVHLNEHQTFVFPLSIEDVRSGQLLKISTTSVVYSGGKLIMTLTIPLLEPTIYELYKIYSYPVAQSIRRKQGGSAYIELRADLVLLSKRRYALAHSRDINKCLIIKGSHICKPTGPLLDTLLQPMCEAAVIMMKQQPFTDCKVKISSTFKPSWTETNQGWLYSLPEEETVDILCDGSWADMVNISGAGILQLKPGCQAETSYATVIGHRHIVNTTLERTSSDDLNVSALMPSVKRMAVLPKDYMDLEEVRREVKQIDYHSLEHKRQISIYIILLIGQFLLGMTFLYLFPIVYSRTYVVKDIPV